MQFGIFSVGDVTPDPTTGRVPTEAERIQAMVKVALKAEEVGLDVFATGEHHNPPFVPSSPTTMLGYIAARTERLVLSTATTLITTTKSISQAKISTGSGSALPVRSIHPRTPFSCLPDPVGICSDMAGRPLCSIPQFPDGLSAPARIVTAHSGQGNRGRLLA